MIVVQSTLEALYGWAPMGLEDRHEALIEAPCWCSRKPARMRNAAEDFRPFAEFPHSLVSCPDRI
jgi:hypothetical protein